MYRAVLLRASQCDLHRFMWREDSRRPLGDFRLKRLTFGVSASSFVANMALRQNTLDHTLSHSQAALDVFYVDDGLMGAGSVEEALRLQAQLQQLFELEGFVLRKWKSSKSTFPLNCLTWIHHRRLHPPANSPMSSVWNGMPPWTHSDQ